MRWSIGFVRGLQFSLSVLWFVGFAALIWGIGTTLYHAFAAPRAAPTGVFTYVPVNLSEIATRVSFSHPGTTDEPQPVEIIRSAAQLQFHNPSDPYFVYGNGVYILWTLAGLGIVHQLKQIFGSIARTRAFVYDNVRRTEVIGVILIAGHLLHALWQCLLSSHYAQMISVAGVEITPIGFGPNWAGIATAVLIIDFAELFRQGVALSEENALTI